MVTGRMLEIIHYLERERMASYKEIAEALGLKERSVRYDVDCINDELSLKGQLEIEKYSKGMLFVPDELDFNKIISDDEFIFSPKERIAIVRLLILFDTGRLNITTLCNQLFVSRRSIQNDIDAVQNEIKEYGLTLTYDKKFKLSGESEQNYEIRRKELENLLCNYEGKTKTKFDDFIDKQVQIIFEPIELEQILKWLDEIIDEMQWTFSDESYRWYVSNVLTFTWYIKNGKKLPDTMYGKEGEIQSRIDQYEQIIGQKLTKTEKEILSSFTKYTKRYENLDINLGLVETEDVVMNLTRKMSEELNIDFSKDGILLKGLLNHVGPLLERIKENVQFNDDIESLIPNEYHYVYDIMEKILKEDKLLNDLTKNEKVYLTVYFLGSIRRTQQSYYKTALLICGYGYGSTAVLKDALLNEYQLYVRKCIPAYQVTKFTDWNDIDVVISTEKIKLPVKKPLAKVNVILEKEDYIKLDLLGIRRKGVLTNYFAIERRLDFLNASDREKVMNIVKEELGYKEVRMPKKYYKLTDLLTKEDIKCIDYVKEWKEAVKIGTNILEMNGKITEAYFDSIIKGMEIQGFYSVTDGKFALLHGNETQSVNESCMSLTISKEPITFGDKKVNIIFCLASRDKKEHVPAIIRLMRMVSMPEFIKTLSICTSSEEAMKVIEKYQEEVETCYQ